ncbi:zinc-dependent metalloprotease [Candidatus Saccharibacteria bacterium]|nr:zinc-dependent metalloprotease [Candidatus Saccharibacteria bacterium]
MINRKIALLLSVATLTLAPATAHAGIFDFLKRKKKPKTEKAPEKSAYEKILTDKAIVSAKGDFLTLHKTDNKLYVELPVKTIGKEILVAVTLSSISNPQLGMVGFKNSNPVHMRFAQRDSAIVLEAVNSDPYLTGQLEKELRPTFAPSYTDLALYKFPIKAWNKDKSAVVFDITSLVTKDQKYFPLIGKSLGSYQVQSSLQSDLGYIREIKAFEDNVSIKIDRSYRITLNSSRGGKSPLKDYPVTLGATFTILRLPEEPMTPRLADTRIGVFHISKNAYDPESKQIEAVRFAKRWRLEPSDVAAYKAGQLVRPKKPIVFYVENTFPAVWKAAMKEGTLRWNKAFEAIGFKDAIEVRDFPTDDPNFDPDNLKYNCIRYVPIATENAMGPSWADPRTGEIINASVLVWSDVSKLNNNWRFIQTAQVDPLVRAMKLPDTLMVKSLKYVIAHEIGHTLGFMHNMAASAAIPTDSLRSASFTQKYGTTASIMDYARFNYVAQPTDKGVSLTPPELGVYDNYAIEWGYRVFPNSKSFRDDVKPLMALVESHDNDPMYRYVLQQSRYRYDPTAIEEDLGDDAVKSSTYGLKNLEYILSHFDEWIPDGTDGTRKAKLYRQMVSQAYGYARNVYAVIGGIKLNQTTESSGIPRYEVMPKEKQRAAAMWLLQEARKFGKRGVESIENRLPQINSHPYKTLAGGIQEMALSATARLALSYYADSTSYSPLEYCEDTYNNVWAKTIAGDENLDDDDIAMQQLYVERLKANIVEVKQVGKVRSLRDDKQDVAFLGFGVGYGEPETMWTETIDRTAEYVFHYAQKLQKLLEERIKTTKDTTIKSQYELMYARVQRYMND